ncbi:hypothetical protein SPHINGO8AM_130140 [Sphingomonas sp. 8AM]|nr:hypothetical protein SPHINGO8AM_130140 [Sphingomonas sp. 8AM]
MIAVPAASGKPADGLRPLAILRELDQFRTVKIRSFGARTAAMIMMAGVAGCDPGVHVAWEKDFRGTVDYDCVEKALRAVAPDVRRGSYQSDGNGPRGFERGIIVTQFNYSDPSFLGGYTLDIAEQPSGATHYWHEWGKIGTRIPPEEQRQVVPLLVRANRSVEQRCGLSFTGTSPMIGDG